MFGRPYRHESTESLQQRAGALINDIQYNALHGHTILSPASRAELRRINRELDRRGEE